VIDELGTLRQLGVGVVSLLGVTADLLLTGGDMLLSISDILFSITALAQGRIGLEFGIDQELARKAFLAVAVLYLTNLVGKLYDRLTTENDS
jgi:hypothetical protein